MGRSRRSGSDVTRSCRRNLPYLRDRTQNPPNTHNRSPFSSRPTRASRPATANSSGRRPLGEHLPAASTPFSVRSWLLLWVPGRPEQQSAPECSCEDQGRGSGRGVRPCHPASTRAARCPCRRCVDDSIATFGLNTSWQVFSTSGYAVATSETSRRPSARPRCPRCGRRRGGGRLPRGPTRRSR
jgi:hypothetical protein